MGARRSWRQQIKIHPVRTVLMALLAVVIVLIILSILGYIFNWNWTGLNGYKNISTATSSPPKITTTVTYLPGKTLWDWLQLLIIPAVLAGAGYAINLTISRSEQEATKQRANSERESSDNRAKTERDIALDNQREAALKDYIDKLSELLLHEDLRKSKEDAELRTIARVRTLTVLPQLDSGRKRSLLQFLFESGLIEKDKRIIDLQGADLSGANLLRAYLPSVDLSGANLQEADLRGAKLQGANLCRVYLSGAHLNIADLRQTDLSDALLAPTNLYGANLYGATLNVSEPFDVSYQPADLRGARLEGANLSRANLSRTILLYALLSGANLVSARLYGADLREVDLSEADLSDVDLSESKLDRAKVTPEQLEKAKSLKGATMPDGDIHS